MMREIIYLYYTRVVFAYCVLCTVYMYIYIIKSSAMIGINSLFERELFILCIQCIRLILYRVVNTSAVLFELKLKLLYNIIEYTKTICCTQQRARARVL